MTIGGFFTYRNGLFADLTLGADTVRVRYNGLSATANATLKLQGGPDSLRLGGTMLITRFGVGANVDFAAFAGSGGVAAPPDPNSITDKIVLDVHVTSSPQLDFQNSYAKLAGNSRSDGAGYDRIANGSGKNPGDRRQCDLRRNDVPVATRRHLLLESGANRPGDRYRRDGARGKL